MNKHYNFFLTLTLACTTVFAQQTIPCFTDEAMRDLFAKDPEAKARYEKSLNEPAPQSFNERQGNSTNAIYFVPDTVAVVFHVLHINGPENVSNTVIYNAMKEVNAIFQKTNSDTTGIDPIFQPIAGRANVYLKLATKDPNGNCTNGIIRYYDPNTDWQQGQTSNYAYSGAGAGRWPTNKYLNIYIVKQIIPSGGSGGGTIVGYTYLPGTWGTNNAPDAIVYHNSFLTGTNARSLAHEIGHWFWLPHTFGSTNSPGTCMSGGASDDFLSNGTAGTGVTDDTPKTPGAFSTCPPSSPNSCDVSNTQNVHNIMDYSSCPKNFTDGQCKRMRNCLGLTTGGRNNLVTAATKISTGTRYPVICAPIADFHASARTVCPNYIITFNDSSANAQTTQWNWSFPGGTFQNGTTATDSMPKVSYATPGTYAVSYTATTSGGSNSITKNTCIQVLNNVATYNTPWTEGFEISTLPGADWATYSTPTYEWMVTNAAAASGANSAWLDNTMNAPGTVSIIESTSFDISTFVTPKFSFKMAYRQQNSTDNDKLQVYTSTDCGSTWTARWTRQGSTLATVTPPSTFPFVPGSANFSTYTVNINGVAGSNNVRFRFVFSADPTGTGGVGNNIYLDDINLWDASVGMASFEEQVSLNIFPNPGHEKINIQMNLDKSREISISVTDVLGRVVETIAPQFYPAGELNMVLGAKKPYLPGAYFISIEADGEKISKKVMIQ